MEYLLLYLSAAAQYLGEDENHKGDHDNDDDDAEVKSCFKNATGQLAAA